jgi:hypothetical protein
VRIALGRAFRYLEGVPELQLSRALGPPGVSQDGPSANIGTDERHWSRSARRTLLASLAGEYGGHAGPRLSSLVAACDQEELVSLAVSEGVAGPAIEKLGPLLAPSARTRLLMVVRQHAARHLGRLAWLQRFGEAFEAANVGWVALKGPVLAELSYRGVTRAYADLDLMVPARQLRLAIDALNGAGAVVADQDWTFLLQIAKGELTLAVHESPLIDLHWHLIYLRSARERFMISTEELLERRRKVQLRGVSAWALDPTDFVAHVALHASSQGFQRLRRLLDIDRTVANEPPDWDALVQRCRAWRVALPVGAMLNAASRTLGTAVPEEVVRDLAGGKPELLVMRQLSGWVPSGLLPGRRSVRTGLSRSLRDTLLATSVEFVGEGRRALGSLAGVRRTSADGPVPGIDPGRSSGFERFMEMVSSADRYGHL